MEPTPFTYDKWLSMLMTCHLAGFQSHGDWRKRQFSKNGTVYDLSCIDLDRLEEIELGGTLELWSVKN